MHHDVAETTCNSSEDSLAKRLSHAAQHLPSNVLSAPGICTVCAPSQPLSLRENETDRFARSIMTPRTLFRIFANAEMVTWAGLILALVLRATGVTDKAVPVAGGLHGFVFLSYCVSTVFVWVNQKWKAGLGVTGLLLAIVPFATVPFELSVDKRGLLAGPWRLAPGGDAPKGFIEHVQAWVLKRPILAIVLLLVGITVVFTVLLWLGPPVPRS